MLITTLPGTPTLKLITNQNLLTHTWTALCVQFCQAHLASSATCAVFCIPWFHFTFTTFDQQTLANQWCTQSLIAGLSYTEASQHSYNNCVPLHPVKINWYSQCLENKSSTSSTIALNQKQMYVNHINKWL